MSRLLWAASAVAIMGFAGSAQAAVTVIGGGLAEACSRAAVAGRQDDASLQTCSLALETELLNTRDRAGTYVNRGVLILRQGRYEQATRDFDQATRIKPNLGEAWVNRGAAYIGMRRYAESLPEINKGLELGVGEPAKAYFNRALAHEGVDDPKAAYMDYQQALAISPEWEAPKRELTRFTVVKR
jgi:tetratricopeptide (TPR) repeat protein